MAEPIDPNDPTSGDPYGQTYQDQMLAKLRPQLEAAIAKHFSRARGGRFGAQGQVLANALAKLQLEIATDAATRSAGYKEQLRKEAVNRQDQLAWENRRNAEIMRVEEAKRTDAWRARSQQEFDAANKARTDAATAEKTNQASLEGKLKNEAYNKFPYDPAHPENERLRQKYYDNMKAWATGQPQAPASVLPQSLANTPAPVVDGKPDYSKGDFGLSKPPFYTDGLKTPDVPPMDLIGGGWKSRIPDPVVSERGGSDVASMGPVQGPGVGAQSAPDVGGSWSWRSRLFNQPGRELGFIPKDTNDFLTSPGGVAMYPPGSGEGVSAPSGYLDQRNRELASRTVPKDFASPTSANGGIYSAPGRISNPLPSEWGANGLDYLAKKTDQYLLDNPGDGGVYHPFSTDTRGDSGGDFNPYTPGNRNVGTPAAGWSGNINSRTPDEFTKTARGWQNRFQDIWRGFGG